MAKGTCTVDGCDRETTAKGYCPAHYSRWKRYGEPGEARIRSNGDRSFQIKYAGQSCSAEGCIRPAKIKALCTPHYARLRKHGDIGTEPIRFKPPDHTHGPVCSVDGCERPEATGGMCGTHYARYRIHGTAGAPEIATRKYADDAKCSVACCDRKPKSGGLCDAHRQRSVNGLPMDTPILYVNQVGALCEFDGCEFKAEGPRYCPRHKAQVKAGKPLSPLKPIPNPSLRDECGRKRCSACETWQAPDEFYPSKRTPDGLHPSCRRCHRNHGMMRRFNITCEQYDKLLADQGGVCAICSKTPRANKKSLAVDHDHACCPGQMTCGKCIRGLVCSTCNLILGMVEDKPDTIVSMARYLQMTTYGRLL